jgi:hypothetical protein
MNADEMRPDQGGGSRKAAAEKGDLRSSAEIRVRIRSWTGGPRQDRHGRGIMA